MIAPQNNKTEPDEEVRRYSLSTDYVFPQSLEKNDRGVGAKKFLVRDF